MPWNDNSNGGGDPPRGNPWGGGGSQSGGGQGGNQGDGGGGNRPGGNPGGNPWGGRPPQGPGNNQGGDLDDMARRLEDRLRVVLGGKGNGQQPRGGGNGGRPGGGELTLDRRAMGAIGAILVFGWLATGFYVVDAGEQAVVQRFGKWVRFADQPGLQYRLPSPIESHTTINVQSVRTLEVGAAGEGGNATDGLMLTRDENIVDVGFNVQWRVTDPAAFLFNIDQVIDTNGQPTGTLAAIAESAMREVVGRSLREQVLTTGRAEVESQTRQLMQRMLDQYGAGITVTLVNLTRAEPPRDVVDAFRQVAAASQEAETKINQARAYQNEVVPQAQGEAARFNQLYQEYRLAPEVTRQRLYIETMEQVYKGANRVLIDPGRGGQAPVMVLPPELLRSQPSQVPSGVTVAPPQAPLPSSPRSSGQ